MTCAHFSSCWLARLVDLGTPRPPKRAGRAVVEAILVLHATAILAHVAAAEHSAD